MSPTRPPRAAAPSRTTACGSSAAIPTARGRRRARALSCSPYPAAGLRLLRWRASQCRPVDATWSCCRTCASAARATASPAAASRSMGCIWTCRSSTPRSPTTRRRKAPACICWAGRTPWSRWRTPLSATTGPWAAAAASSSTASACCGPPWTPGSKATARAATVAASTRAFRPCVARARRFRCRATSPTATAAGFTSSDPPPTSNRREVPALSTL